MAEVTVTIRQAIPEDAEELLQVLAKIGGETTYLIMDARGLALSVDQLQAQIAALYQAPNHLLLVAKVDNQLVGTASVKADESPRIAHIGEIGLSILKEYWGMGLGTLLMEELILWAQQSGVIRRLELTVQARNQRAVALYEKMGFQREGILARGAQTDQGEFLDVYMMRLLIDPVS